MNPDDIQKLWQSEQHGEIHGDMASQIAELRKNHAKLRTTVFWRDMREVIIGLILIPVFYIGARNPAQPWTLYLPIAAIVFVIVFILVDRQAQKRRRVPAAGSITSFIDQAIADVEHQIWLLRNVAWWYMLPLYLAINIYFAHVTLRQANDQPYAWIVGALLVAFCTALYWGIYKLNQSAVKKQLEPRLQELVALKQKVEE